MGSMEKIRAVKNAVYELAKTFPAEEKYSLAGQLIRSSGSTSTQIAEGHGRRTFPGRLRFCIIARCSLSETLNHLADALDCKYISAQLFESFKQKAIEVEKLLNGYINFLEKKNIT